MIRESGEDYLETIYIMLRRNPNLHMVDIANELNYSRPSITRAIKILQKNGYLTVDAVTNHISLTEAGRIKASEVFERHRALTEILIKIGVSPEIAAKDACRIEHDISGETFQCIKEFLERTTKDS
ncbi:MAG: metal-dependent transcriptional regulator [Clostridiales bacterium]|jgi:Mn-dependent DtxR family transcriptional regulator|nr:metal-dependent transcriptional regulator [Clostridiales bacterium]